MSLGPKTRKESIVWAKTFALDSDQVEEAIASYLTLIAEQAGSSVSDVEAAKSLARLRKSLRKELKDDQLAPERARQLDDMADRLSSSIGHASALEQAGLSEGLGALRPRLEAAQQLVRALRAAIARRAKE